MDFEILRGVFGDDLGMFCVVAWHVLALEKSTYIDFQKIDFLKIGVSCAA